MTRSSAVASHGPVRLDLHVEAEPRSRLAELVDLDALVPFHLRCQRSHVPVPGVVGSVGGHVGTATVVLGHQIEEESISVRAPSRA